MAFFPTTSSIVSTSLMSKIPSGSPVLKIIWIIPLDEANLWRDRIIVSIRQVWNCYHPPSFHQIVDQVGADKAIVARHQGSHRLALSFLFGPGASNSSQPAAHRTVVGVQIPRITPSTSERVDIVLRSPDQIIQMSNVVIIMRLGMNNPGIGCR